MRAPRALLWGTATIVTLVLMSTPAEATWSVVVADPSSKHVAVGFASCISADALGEPVGPLVPMVFVPGEAGGIFTETVDTSVDAEMVALLSGGLSPEEVVNTVADTVSETRSRGQYGAVTVDGASASRSGADLEGVSETGASFVVQGSSLASPDVIDRASAEVLRGQTEGLPLEEIVVRSLVAGSEAGGDLRCGDQTALFAQVVVVGPDDTAQNPGFILTVLVDEGDGQNPVMLLREEYTAGSSGLVDSGQGSGRGLVVYSLAAIAVLIMISSGFVVFRHGIGNRAARR